MKGRWVTIVFVILVFLLLVGYLVTETVGVDKIAAHYRLGDVVAIIRPEVGVGDENRPPIRQDAEWAKVPVIKNAGLFFKLPLIDRIEKFDQRIRYVDGPLKQSQLSDQNQVIPRVFATWRINDPVAFRKSLDGEWRNAEETLKQIIAGRTPEVIGRYRLHDIVNTDRTQLRFDQIEEEVAAAIKASVESAAKSYGIEVCSAGISWIALPEDATTAVFARMEQERKTEATKLVEEGRKIRRTAVADAQAKRDAILAEAEAKAKAIRADGEREAAKSYDLFAQDQELAIYLRRLDAFRNMAQNAVESRQPMVFVLSTETEPFDILKHGPLASGQAGVDASKLSTMPEPLAPPLAGAEAK